MIDLAASQAEMRQRQLPASDSDLLSLSEKVKQTSHALTAEDLADLLQVSRLTVLRKAKKGVIPSFRVGSLVRFDPKSISVWLRKQGVQ